MRVALVAMPWSMSTQPSAALGALAAYVHREQPSYELVSRYEYLQVGAQLSFAFYNDIAQNKHDLGELLYTPLIYPQKLEAVQQYFVDWAPQRWGDRPPEKYGVASWADVFQWLERKLRSHVDQLADELTGFDVVGFTTCYGQLFPNLAVCQRLKRTGTKTVTILGGSTISARVGPSVLREFPGVDYVIQGEGERPLTALLRAIESASPTAIPIKGVIARAQATESANGAELWEVDRLDDLPIPEYDEYAKAAKDYKLEWSLPIEGSRGCWWDRTKRSGNPRNTCYFCNLNVQWGGYREKSIDRLVSEVSQLTEQHAVTRIYFLDNIIRHTGIDRFARAMAALGKDFHLFYEMRANVSPHDILLLWEAGLKQAQIGIEGLSTSYLKRIGKGTTVIRNLQVLKACYELGISHGANLVTGFPGSTNDEIAETCRNIELYALAYEPCHTSPFNLGVDSTVDQLRQEFGITNVRNSDIFRFGLPEEVWQRVKLFDLSYDDATRVDWSPVREACEQWAKLHAPPSEPLLEYFDGGTFVRINDRRFGIRTLVLRGRARKIYLYCAEIRSLERIAKRFEGEGTPAELKALLERLVEQQVMFEEEGKYLSLATACSAQAAARRIRAAHAEDEKLASQNPQPRRLPLAAIP